MEKFFRAVLILCLAALAVLTPVWLLTGRAAALSPAASPSPEPTPSPDPVVLCAERYEQALEALRDGRQEEALPLLEELGDYRDAADLVEGLHSVLYARAMERLYARDLEGAQPLLQLLAPYEDSLLWLRYCMRWQNAAPAEKPLLRPSMLVFTPKSGCGSVYLCESGMIYVPAELSRDTALVVYCPGGSDSKTLNEDAVYNYVARYAPNAVCFFSYANGFYDTTRFNRELWALIEELMRECSLVPHEVYLVGTSNGFYTTMALAVSLLQEEGIPVRALMSWDAGENWTLKDRLLSGEELSALAEAGTRFVLFEQRNFSPERAVVQDMVKAGLRVQLIACRNGDHDRITENAFRYGTLSWLLGEIDLYEQEYTLTELSS